MTRQLTQGCMTKGQSQNLNSGSMAPEPLLLVTCLYILPLETRMLIEQKVINWGDQLDTEVDRDTGQGCDSYDRIQMTMQVTLATH